MMGNINNKEKVLDKNIIGSTVVHTVKNLKQLKR